jgi:hypothetical protein
MQGVKVLDLTKLPENRVLSTNPPAAAEAAANQATR